MAIRSEDYIVFRWLLNEIRLSVVILALAFLSPVAIAYLVSAWSIGALIVGSAEAAEGRKPSFWGMARRSTARYIRMLAIQFVLSLPVLVLVALMLVVFWLAIINPDPTYRLPSVVVVCFSALLVLALYGLIICFRLSTRAALIEDLPWLQAIRQGIQVGLRRRVDVILNFVMVDFPAYGLMAIVANGVSIFRVSIFTEVIRAFGLVEIPISMEPSAKQMILPLILVSAACSIGLTGLAISPFISFVEAAWTLAYKSWTGRNHGPDKSVDMDEG